ncbi:MAG: class I SAM-dependent methyltransferase [Solirubrobacteraceae bacterium]
MAPAVENPLFARFYHRFCGRDLGNGEDELRREMLEGVAGRVVEVGAGNGINFAHYPATAAEVIAVEPEPYLRSKARRPPPTLPSRLYLRFYEHVRSRRPGFARWQHHLDPLWARLFGGCHPDRDTVAAITAAGFHLERCRGFGFPPDSRVTPVVPRVLGVARVA